MDVFLFMRLSELCFRDELVCTPFCLAQCVLLGCSSIIPSLNTCTLPLQTATLV